MSLPTPLRGVPSSSGAVSCSRGFSDGFSDGLSDGFFVARDPAKFPRSLRRTQVSLELARATGMKLTIESTGMPSLGSGSSSSGELKVSRSSVVKSMPWARGRAARSDRPDESDGAAAGSGLDEPCDERARRERMLCRTLSILRSMDSARARASASDRDVGLRGLRGEAGPAECPDCRSDRRADRRSVGVPPVEKRRDAGPPLDRRREAGPPFDRRPDGVAAFDWRSRLCMDCSTCPILRSMDAASSSASCGGGSMGVGGDGGADEGIAQGRCGSAGAVVRGAGGGGCSRRAGRDRQRCAMVTGRIMSLYSGGGCCIGCTHCVGMQRAGLSSRLLRRCRRLANIAGEDSATKCKIAALGLRGDHWLPPPAGISSPHPIGSPTGACTHSGRTPPAAALMTPSAAPAWANITS